MGEVDVANGLSTGWFVGILILREGLEVLAAGAPLAGPETGEVGLPQANGFDTLKLNKEKSISYNISKDQ